MYTQIHTAAVLTACLWYGMIHNQKPRQLSRQCLGDDSASSLCRAQHSLHRGVQESWQHLQQRCNGNAVDEPVTGGNGTLLLRVIATSAARFPAEQAAQLAADLLKVRTPLSCWQKLLGVAVCNVPPHLLTTEQSACCAADTCTATCWQFLHERPHMLVQAVERFGLSPTAATAHIAALAQLTATRSEAKAAGSTTQSLPDAAAWGGTVLQAAEEELGKFVEQVCRQQLVVFTDVHCANKCLCRTFPPA